MTLDFLRENPFLQDSKKLKGTSDYHRVDIGEYRVIYRIDAVAKIVIIAFIGKHNDNEVYKKFKRKKVHLSEVTTSTVLGE
jgi:mRNA interferase RelE/StbE